MRRPAAWLSTLALAAGTLLAVAMPARASTPSPSKVAADQAGLGVNLTAPVDWTTEWPFVDLFRTSRDWISQKSGADWGKGPALSVDADGWVTRLEKDSWADAAILTNELGSYPKGKFVVTWAGQGDVSIW